jgi:hypothetical protein
MTTITLEINVSNDKLIKQVDKNKLSFLVSRVFDEYIEDIQDQELSKQIKNSKQLDYINSDEYKNEERNFVDSDVFIAELKSKMNV